MLNRKTPIHLPPREDINRALIVFVTVCTDARRNILNLPDAHRLILDAWQQADSWKVGRYVIMPEHIHLFCAPSGGRYAAFGKWVQYWKALVSLSWPRPNEQPIWQRSFWDVQLREGDRYDEKWHYVCSNPVRKGLVPRSEDWVLQGELNILEW